MTLDTLVTTLQSALAEPPSGSDARLLGYVLELASVVAEMRHAVEDNARLLADARLDAIEADPRSPSYSYLLSDNKRINDKLIAALAERDTLAADVERAERERVETVGLLKASYDRNDLLAADVQRLTANNARLSQLAAERYEEAEELHATLGNAVQTARPTIAGLREQLQQALRDRDAWKLAVQTARPTIAGLSEQLEHATRERDAWKLDAENQRTRAEACERETVDRIATWLSAKVANGWIGESRTAALRDAAADLRDGTWKETAR